MVLNNVLAVESKESNQGILDALSDLEIKECDEYYPTFVGVRSQVGSANN